MAQRRKREKGYWEKRTERFADGTAAKSRAQHLRTHEHVSHVTVEKSGDEYVVTYSVAKWYLEDLDRAGIAL